MQNILRILRYVVLALIIVCNAIIASVAVWNQSVSPASASVYAIDICATCLAALGLVFSFTILFLELAGQDSVTGKVWFECTWVSALFVVNLAVASAASAILVTQSCIPNFVDACTSTQTLLSFSWLLTFILLIYALTLFSSIYLMRGEHHNIWSTRVNQIPRISPKHKLSSGPPTPVFATFANIPRAPSLVAPVPRPFRTFPMDDSCLHHSVFDPEQGIEHFEPQVHHFESQAHFAPRPLERLPTLSDDSHIHHSGLDPKYEVEYFEPQAHPAPRPIQRLPTLSDVNHRPAPSLYPQFIQGALQSEPEAQQQQPSSALERQESLAQRMPSPPPLANWPRHDVLSQPVKSKRAKNSVDSNKALAPNASQHPLGPRGMPEDDRAVDEAGP